MNSKETLTVGEIKAFIKDLPDSMKVYVVSDDELPVRKVIDISSEIRVGYYSELYLDTVDLGSK